VLGAWVIQENVTACQMARVQIVILLSYYSFKTTCFFAGVGELAADVVCLIITDYRFLYITTSFSKIQVTQQISIQI